MTRRRQPSLSEYVDGVLDGTRGVLARAITLVESRRDDDQALAAELLTSLMPHTGDALRLGVTGVPGVGKSTFIEALGTRLTGRDHRVAVLAVDPSSTRSGGSILGDKTRMNELARDPNAFVRPTPTSGTLGGVASTTRETMLLCEAAGYDIVIVETVGVGQSELTVAQMTDFFLVLMLAGAGDELQGIKRGLLELADALVINKADGDNVVPARRAASTFRSALALMSQGRTWRPKVLTCSALHDQGIDDVWDVVLEHRRTLRKSGAWDARRKEQRLEWMWSLIDAGLKRAFRRDASVRDDVDDVEAAVRRGELAPPAAARRLLQHFGVSG